jgi:O-acetyl-ADP-ribose deacetylase (regulator of RNase III)
LENATQNTLQLAVDHGLKSVALPAISTGIFGFPIERCAGIMIDTTHKYLKKNNAPARVIFCLWGKENYRVFKRKVKEIINIEE